MILRMEENICRHRQSAEDSDKNAMTLPETQATAKVAWGTVSNTHLQWSEKVITMISKPTLQPSAVTVLGYMVTEQGLTATHGLTSSPLKMSAKCNVCIHRALPQHLYKKAKMLQLWQGKKESEWSSELNIRHTEGEGCWRRKAFSLCSDWAEEWATQSPVRAPWKCSITKLILPTVSQELLTVWVAPTELSLWCGSDTGSFQKQSCAPPTCRAHKGTEWHFQETRAQNVSSRNAQLRKSYTAMNHVSWARWQETTGSSALKWLNIFFPWNQAHH